MHKLDQLKIMFSCTIFSKLLVEPVTLPCGKYTVCKSHLNDYISQKTFECLCKQENSVQGFFINKFIQDQLKMQLNSIKINPVFDECKNEIESANKSVAQINKIEQDPEGYIYNYFEDFKRQIDLRREVLKEEIDVYSDKLIQSINKTQTYYIKLSREENDVKTKIKLYFCAD